MSFSTSATTPRASKGRWVSWTRQRIWRLTLRDLDRESDSHSGAQLQLPAICSTELRSAQAAVSSSTSKLSCSSSASSGSARIALTKNSVPQSWSHTLKVCFLAQLVFGILALACQRADVAASGGRTNE